MVRVRFAPSPTGALHIGGVRTALFNYLFARHSKGVFILRIENTDAARSTAESVKMILDGMEWLGLEWDEGPYYQTDKLDRYRELAHQLLDRGHAYQCYCLPEELEQRRKEAQAQGLSPGYDGRCRNLTSPPSGKDSVIRLKTPDEGTIEFTDAIRGDVVVQKRELDDLIILRSDGSPTYNFSVVVDDYDMKITHVIRGDDHLSNTPRQLQIYEALGFQPPEFAHLPMILGEDKARLSKRHNAKSVHEYRDEGYLPVGLINYLSRLGWSYGDEEIFTKTELIDKFTLDNVGKSAGVFNPDKLLAINAHHIRATEDKELIDPVSRIINNRNLDIPPEPDLLKLIAMLKPRSQTLVEMVDRMDFYFRAPSEYEEKAARKFLTPETMPLLARYLENISGLENFDETVLHETTNALLERESLKLKHIAQPVRVALTGGSVSPGLFEMMAVLGKEETLARIRAALDKCT